MLLAIKPHNCASFSDNPCLFQRNILADPFLFFLYRSFYNPSLCLLSWHSFSAVEIFLAIQYFLLTQYSDDPLCLVVPIFLTIPNFLAMSIQEQTLAGPASKTIYTLKVREHQQQGVTERDVVYLG